MAKSSAIAPLGLGYIASVLLESGFDVRIVDMDVEDTDVRELSEILGSYRPSVVGISTTTLTLRNGLRVAKIVKQTSPESVVCFGGPHVSVAHEDAFAYPFVDVVVCGEGEHAFRDLCVAVAEGVSTPNPIPGTVWRSASGPIVAPARPRLADLDSLPFPARHLMPLYRYNIPGTIVTSRGCPHACGFCAGPTVLGRRYSVRSSDNVVAEVRTCVDLFHLTSFYFVDDTMTHDVRRLREICEGLRRIRIPESLGRELKWTCESRADKITRDILKDMRSAGCTTIQFGMESGSQRLLDDLHKHVTLDQIENAVKWSRDAGISPVLSMVFPHPNETEQTLTETIKFIRKLYDLGAEKIIPSLLTLFPGTPFMDNRETLGMELLTSDFDEFNLGTPILVTRDMDREAIVNGYSRLLLLTQRLGGSEIGGLAIIDPAKETHDWMAC